MDFKLIEMIFMLVLCKVFVDLLILFLEVFCDKIINILGIFILFFWLKSFWLVRFNVFFVIFIVLGYEIFLIVIVKLLGEVYFLKGMINWGIVL